MSPNILWNIHDSTTYPFRGANWWLFYPTQSPGVCQAQLHSIMLMWFVSPYSETASPSIQVQDGQGKKDRVAKASLVSSLYVKIYSVWGYHCWIQKCFVTYKLAKRATVLIPFQSSATYSIFTTTCIMLCHKVMFHSTKVRTHTAQNWSNDGNSHWQWMEVTTAKTNLSMQADWINSQVIES